MTTTDPLDLLGRIINAYDDFTAAELDLEAREIELFRKALADCIREAAELTGSERRPRTFRRDPPPGGGWV